MPTVSLTLDTNNANRLASAIGKRLALGRDATLAEVKSYIVTICKNIVLDTERLAALRAISTTPVDIT